MSILDGKLVSSTSGGEISLKGVNWFGFNCQGIGMVSSLDKNNITIAVDFKTIVLRMKLLGFNCVRLPFSFQVVPLQIPGLSFSRAAVQHAVKWPGSTTGGAV